MRTRRQAQKVDVLLSVYHRTTGRGSVIRLPPGESFSGGEAARRQ